MGCLLDGDGDGGLLGTAVGKLVGDPGICVGFLVGMWLGKDEGQREETEDGSID